MGTLHCSSHHGRPPLPGNPMNEAAFHDRDVLAKERLVGQVILPEERHRTVGILSLNPHRIGDERAVRVVYIFGSLKGPQTC